MGRRSEKKLSKVGVKAISAAVERLDTPTTADESARTKSGQKPRLPFAPEQKLLGRGAVLAICLFLVIATLAVFGRTVGFHFVAYDDDVYVSANHHVRGGLSLSGIKWAWTHAHGSNWHPLTTLSHMLDCSLYGLWPGGHHLTNVLLHASSSVVLFLALRKLTGAVWRSGLVAALFCLHPLHVESVAWVAERMDVLSGLLFGLTLWAYAGYARQPNSWTRYLGVVMLFALGLLCKPMLVTLPLLLLLLDYWPLRRFPGDLNSAAQTADSIDATSASRSPLHTSWVSLIREKIPLMLLSLGSCAVTYWVQSTTGAVSDVEPWGMRLQTALAAYVGYLVKMVWPFGLAVPYPRVREPAVLTTVACGLALAAVTIGVLHAARRGHRYLAVGWFWYLGMLVPVIGLITIGDQAMADHYTYLPLLGIFVALVWGAAELLGRLGAKWELGLVSVLLMFCAVRSIDQSGYWCDSATLFRHALDVTSSNAMAHTKLGLALAAQGSVAEGIEQCKTALRVDPDFVAGHDELAKVYHTLGRLPDAADEWREVLRLQPGHAAASKGLGMVLTKVGRGTDAMPLLKAALTAEPRDLETRNYLAFAFLADNRPREAVSEFRNVLLVDPKNQMALNSLAWIEATSTDAAIRNGEDAVELAQTAVAQWKVVPPQLLDTLAAAYAEMGRFKLAADTARKAQEKSAQGSDQALIEAIYARGELYESRKPYREAMPQSNLPRTVP